GVTTVVLVIMAGAVLALGVDVPPPTGRTWQPLDWLLVALMAVAVLSAVLSRSRLAALALVGVAGFTTALWLFFLGAFDVALTQLLVERSEEHTSELQSRFDLVCRLLLDKKNRT